MISNVMSNKRGAPSGAFAEQGNREAFSSMYIDILTNKHCPVLGIITKDNFRGDRKHRKKDTIRGAAVF